MKFILICIYLEKYCFREGQILNLPFYMGFLLTEV